MTMQSQIIILALIRAIRMFMITMPVIVLYWQSHGLEMKDIFILQVIFSVCVIVFEVPSGYFADRFGHRYSMIWGSVCGTLGFFCYWAFPSYLGFVAAEVILALGAGFISGARDALLYDTLEAHGNKDRYTKYQGRLIAIGNVSEALAAVTAGVVAWYGGINTVLLVQWVLLVLTVPLSWSLVEIRNRKGAVVVPLLQTVKRALHEDRSLRYLNLLAGGVGASTLTMVWFVQPQWESLGVPVLYFGYLWAALNLFAALGGVIAHRLEQRLSMTTIFLLLASAPAALYVLSGVFYASLLTLVIVPLYWVLRGIYLPIMQDYVQRACRPEERATVLSINALSTRVVFSISSPFLGWLTDIWSFQTAFFAAALIYGSISLLAYGGFYVANKKQPATV